MQEACSDHFDKCVNMMVISCRSNMWLDNDENTAALGGRVREDSRRDNMLVLHSPSIASLVLDQSEGTCEREYNYS